MRCTVKGRWSRIRHDTVLKKKSFFRLPSWSLVSPTTERYQLQCGRRAHLSSCVMSNRCGFGGGGDDECLDFLTFHQELWYALICLIYLDDYGQLWSIMVDLYCGYICRTSVCSVLAVVVVLFGRYQSPLLLQARVTLQAGHRYRCLAGGMLSNIWIGGWWLDFIVKFTPFLMQRPKKIAERGWRMMAVGICQAVLRCHNVTRAVRSLRDVADLFPTMNCGDNFLDVTLRFQFSSFVCFPILAFSIVTTMFIHVSYQFLNILFFWMCFVFFCFHQNVERKTSQKTAQASAWKEVPGVSCACRRRPGQAVWGWPWWETWHNGRHLWYQQDMTKKNVTKQIPRLQKQTSFRKTLWPDEFTKNSSGVRIQLPLAIVCTYRYPRNTNMHTL